MRIVDSDVSYCLYRHYGGHLVRVLSLSALWRASGLSIAWCKRSRFHGGGLWAIMHGSMVLFYDICIFVVILWHFAWYGYNIFTLALLRFFMIFCVIFGLIMRILIMNDWMNDENMDENEWIYVLKYEWMKEIREKKPK